MRKSILLVANVISYAEKKRLGLHRNQIFNQGSFLGGRGGEQSYLENCAYL